MRRIDVLIIFLRGGSTGGAYSTAPKNMGGATLDGHHMDMVWYVIGTIRM